MRDQQQSDVSKPSSNLTAVRAYCLQCRERATKVGSESERKREREREREREIEREVGRERLGVSVRERGKRVTSQNMATARVRRVLDEHLEILNSKIPESYFSSRL